MDNLEKEVNVNMPGQLSLKKERPQWDFLVK